MSHELTFRQWHHGYLGVILLAWGLAHASLPFIVAGLLIVVDDLIEHSVQYVTRSEWQSPLRRLYGLVYKRSKWVRKVNLWLDELFR
jgi:hypothetical protein